MASPPGRKSTSGPTNKRMSSTAKREPSVVGTPVGLADRAVLHVSPDYFVVEDCGKDRGSAPYATIDRLNKTLSHCESNPVDDRTTSGDQPPSQRQIHGVIGVIDLLSGPCLVVITERRFIGKIYDHDIWEVAATEVLPFARNNRHLATVQVENEKAYLELLQSALSGNRLYFSYSYDLTHSLQKLHSSGQRFYTSSLYKRVEKRFCWNQHLQANLKKYGAMQRYELPVMSGFVKVAGQVAVNGQLLETILISRRSHRRAGTRFNTRGIDRSGNVANFAESEQICKVGDNYMSYVQIRGSIPLFWKQVPTLKYKPPVEIATSSDHIGAVRRHFGEMRVFYGKQSLISLINHHGHEGDLAKRFAESMDQLQDLDVRFYPFDFHKECSRMRWDRLSILMDQLKEDHKVQGSFIARSDKKADMVQIMSFQKGVFRTNCIDCLDRTNVVQNMLAKEALQAQLRQLGVFAPTESIAGHAALVDMIHNVWADNADVLSSQYAGSLALKTDFTRTGKRTVAGMLADLKSSILRYFKNNFTDGYKQDGVNLLLGDYVVDPLEGVSKPSQLASNAPMSRTIPSALLLCCFGILALGSLQPDSVPFLQQFRKMTLLLTLLLIAVIYRQARQLVNNPQLVRNLSHTF